MFRNVASKFTVVAFDSATGLRKTGDAANITAYVSKDNGAPATLADTTAHEVDPTKAPGYYEFDAAQGETDGDKLLVTATLVTLGIEVLGAPAVIYTRPTTGWLAPAVAGRLLAVTPAGQSGIDLNNIGVPTTDAAKLLGILSYGTLVNIDDTSVTLWASHNLDPEGNYAIELTGGTHAEGKSRLLKFNTGSKFDVSPSWVSDSETRPSGTITAYLFPAPKVPTDSTLLPSVKLTVDGLDAPFNIEASQAAGNKVESGVSFIQLFRRLASVLSGKTDKPDGTHRRFMAMNNPTQERVRDTIDGAGNRSAESYTDTPT